MILLSSIVLCVEGFKVTPENKITMTGTDFIILNTTFTSKSYYNCDKRDKFLHPDWMLLTMVIIYRLKFQTQYSHFNTK